MLRICAELMNQCVFRHSALNLPLKDSMKLLSVGLPGREMPKAGRAKRSQLEDHALLISPEVEVPSDELGALIDTDRLGIADAPADPLERQNDVLSPIAEARIHRRREPREGVHDGEDTDLAARGQLVVHEVHCPCLVDPDRVGAILAQLRLYAPFGDLVAQLQAHLLVQAIDPLRIDRPAVAPQQNMDAPVAVTDACLADISNALLKVGLAADRVPSRGVGAATWEQS